MVETTTLDIAVWRAGDRRTSARPVAAALTSSPPTRARWHSPIARWPTRPRAAACRFSSKARSWTASRSSTWCARRCPACTIRGFRGVVNSTTNYMLTAMERGEPFDAALARMQAAGVAEADPSLDVDGWDAAAKAAALANVLAGRGHRRRSTSSAKASAPATGERARAALARGRRLKLVASRVRQRRDARRARVELEELAARRSARHPRRPGQCARDRHLAARPHRDHPARRRTREDGVRAADRSDDGGARRGMVGGRA